MKVNLGPTDRLVRGILGVTFLGVGLLAGRRTWWGLLLDVLGATLLLNAKTAFCHVYQTFGDFSTAGKRQI